MIPSINMQQEIQGLESAAQEVAEKNQQGRLSRLVSVSMSWFKQISDPNVEFKKHLNNLLLLNTESSLDEKVIAKIKDCLDRVFVQEDELLDKTLILAQLRDSAAQSKLEEWIVEAAQKPSLTAKELNDILNEVAVLQGINYQGDLKNSLFQLFETHAKARPAEGIKLATYLAYYDKELAIALLRPLANEWLKDNNTKDVGLKAYASLLEQLEAQHSEQLVVKKELLDELHLFGLIHHYGKAAINYHSASLADALTLLGGSAFGAQMMRNKKVINDVQNSIRNWWNGLGTHSQSPDIAREIYSLQARHGDLRGIEGLKNLALHHAVGMEVEAREFKDHQQIYDFHTPSKLAEPIHEENAQLNYHLFKAPSLNVHVKEVGEAISRESKSTFNSNLLNPLASTLKTSLIEQEQSGHTTKVDFSASLLQIPSLSVTTTELTYTIKVSLDQTKQAALALKEFVPLFSEAQQAIADITNELEKQTGELKSSPEASKVFHFCDLALALSAIEPSHKEQAVKDLKDFRQSFESSYWSFGGLVARDIDPSVAIKIQETLYTLTQDIKELETLQAVADDYLLGKGKLKKNLNHAQSCYQIISKHAPRNSKLQFDARQGLERIDELKRAQQKS